MIVFEKADHEPRERKRCGVIAAMCQGIMGMTNSSDPVLLTEAAPNKKNFLTPCSVAMSGRIVGLSCERFLKQREPSRCAFRHYAVSQWDSAQHQIVCTEVTGSFTFYAL